MDEQTTEDTAERVTEHTEADIGETATEADSTEGTGQTFTAEYVGKLRDENAKLRIRAQRTDELAHRLHAELVRATGQLADPADLDYNEDHLTDPEALTAAIDALLTAKPHLRNRTPKGDVGQGNRGAGAEPASWLGVLKQFA